MQKETNQLGSRLDAQFTIDYRQMILYRFNCDTQSLCNLAITQSFRHQQCHLPFAWGKSIHHVSPCKRPQGRAIFAKFAVRDNLLSPTKKFRRLRRENGAAVIFISGSILTIEQLQKRRWGYPLCSAFIKEPPL